jgi:hypothetical protein
MKIQILFIILLAIISQSHAQSAKDTSTKYPLVHVKDWSQKSFLFSEDFWDNKRDELVKQVGQDGFEKIKTYSNYRHIPSQMSVFDGKKKIDPQELYKRLDSLKVYKYATFKHIYQGKDWGEYVVLMVPYKGNANWNSLARWDTIFLILPAEAIEEIHYKP